MKRYLNQWTCLTAFYSLKFVAADLGSGYTVEEQVTGKAEFGGLQFDIFPRRPGVDGRFINHAGRELDSVSSPSELELVIGDQLTLERYISVSLSPNFVLT